MEQGKIFCICNQKGGCGKTTISMHLAGELTLKHKKKCIVVDADAQNSALNWSALNKIQKLPFHVIDLSEAGFDLHKKLYNLVDGFDCIVVDCPPAANSPIMLSALLVADFALIPFIASGVDLLALLMLYKKIQEIKVKNRNLNVRILLNMFEERTQSTKKALESVKEFGIPILQNFFKKRTIFRDAVTEGTLVQLLKKKDKDALSEIQNVTHEILSL